MPCLRWPGGRWRWRAIRRRYRGLLVDFGGVLTSSLREAFRDFCEQEGVEFQRLRDLVRASYAGEAGEDLIHLIETGRISTEAFEEKLAEVLSEGAERPLSHHGLLDRMLARLELDRPMIEAVRRVNRAGIKTGLLSNSWGLEVYPRDVLAEVFDDVVISGEVGMRKPDREVFLLAARRLELAPGACVFVDDVQGNIDAAESVGMRGVLHERADRTIAELETLLDVSLELPRSDGVDTMRPTSERRP